MNLRDLHYLITVAETLHFGKAAARCNVSQPTLSMQLKKLEETLGVQLFERTNKRVMLTPIGTDIAARAQRVLAEAAQITLAARAAREPDSGSLRLGLFPTLAPYLLPSLMPQLTQYFPKLSLQLVEEKTPVLIQQLESGALDAALLAMPVASDALHCATLFAEPFLLTVSRQHPLAKRKTVTLDDMHGQTMLLLEDGHCLRDQALAVCQLAGVGESTNFRATSLETLRHMVASSDAITLIPKLAVRAEDSQLRYLPFRTNAPMRQIGLYWRTTSARRPLFEAIAAHIRTQYGRI